MARLKMLRGPEPGEEFVLDKDTILIGRGRKNDIIIQDNEVSRTHCRLIRVLDDYEIHDMKSTNGTFVNGRPVTQGGWLLSAHAIVELGDSITLEYTPTDMVTSHGIAVDDLGFDEEEVFYLVIQQASAPQPEIYLLDKLSVSIGREMDNDIVLQEPEASRHHLRMLITETGYAIEDLGTLNGTYVNERRLEQQRPLRISDIIRIGEGIQMWYTDDPDHLIEDLRRGKSISRGTTDDETYESRPPIQEKPTDEIEMPSALVLQYGLNTEQFERSVFLICAADEWKIMAMRLYKYLKDHHVPIWAAQELGEESEIWDVAIEQAQAASPLLLAVISEKSLQESYMQRSLRHFIAREKPILLVRFGEVERAPMPIQNLPAVNFDRKNPMRTFRTILAEIQKLNLSDES